MKGKSFRIAALVAGTALLLMAFLSGPATAEPRRLLVTLLGGREVAITVDAAPGTPVGSIPLPDLGMPVEHVVELPSAAPPVTAPATTMTSAGTTVTGPPTTIAGPPTTGTTAPALTGTGTTTSPDVGGVVKPKGQPQGETRSGAVAVPPASPQAGSGRGALQDASPSPSRAVQTTPAGAAPSPAAPGFTLVPSGPAPLGVPNFFIENFRIPPFLLPIYQAAGIQYGVPWQVLAAINEIETDYGRNLSVSSAGAIGWMQFMPSSWALYGVDANGDGVKDPYNPVDAIFAAARYLKAAGADTNLARAIFAYNHADWYVQSVLLRARVIGGMPADLVGSLTGLTEGHFPVAGRATYADGLNVKAATRPAHGGNAAVPVDGNPARRSINIFARAGTPTIAVNDGRVAKLGRDPQLGNFVVLQDVYGNRYTYAHLASLSSRYPVPKQQPAPTSNTELEVPKADAKPTAPATAGSQPTTVAGDASAQPRAAAQPQPDAAPAASAKERLFAHPERPAAYAAGGKRQLAELGQSLQSLDGYFTEALQADPRDYVLKPLQAGSNVIAGTILGRIGKTDPTLAPHVEFSIRPAGRGAPTIDPKPILDGWKLLEATAIYRANGKNAFTAANGAGPSIGQILLMSKEQLQQRVLADPNVDVYACGRQDIASGQIDRRVLATIEFLVASGLKPTISSLKCGHGYYTTSGNVSEHSSGDAVDIAAINGIPIAGHQGAGSITDITIRRLLTLQGAMKPHQIISLMTYPGTDNTLALPDHWNHIHVGFHPAGDLLGGQKLQQILKPSQWTKLVEHLASIPNPVVPQHASKYAIKDGRGD